MKKAIPVDVYDKDGNLTKIEVNDTSGNHIFDALWDPADEQTSGNRSEFRKWVYVMIRRKGYEIHE